MSSTPPGYMGPLPTPITEFPPENQDPVGCNAAVWDIIQSNLNSAYDYFGSKSTWNTIQGTSFTNIIGLPTGSRVNNVMGNDVRIVCPWWGLLFRPILGPTTAVGPMGFLTGGIGGDTDMVFGKKNSFTYFSATANCEFGINKIKVNYQVPDGMDIATALKVAGARTLYYLPVITALLGALVLTVMTLCLKHIWRFSSSTDPSNDKTVMTRAMGLFPSVESEWLYLVQYLHSRGAALIPLKIPLFEQLSASSLIEAQVDVLKKEIKIGKQRAKDWELNLEEMDFISGENVNLYALSEPSIIAIAEMAENKVEEVDKSTLTQAESIVEIMKPQT
jgi:hypothetical protein